MNRKAVSHIGFGMSSLCGASWSASDFVPPCCGFFRWLLIDRSIHRFLCDAQGFRCFVPMRPGLHDVRLSLRSSCRVGRRVRSRGDVPSTTLFLVCTRWQRLMKLRHRYQSKQPMRCLTHLYLWMEAERDDYLVPRLLRHFLAKVKRAARLGAVHHLEPRVASRILGSYGDQQYRDALKMTQTNLSISSRVGKRNQPGRHPSSGRGNSRGGCLFERRHCWVPIRGIFCTNVWPHLLGRG